jgi:protein-tyrosine phosphatase
MSTTYKPAPRCYTTHPKFEIAPGAFMRGGSAAYPHKDAEFFVALDRSYEHTAAFLPWNNNGVLYPIINGRVPKQLDHFNRLLDWMSVHLAAGMTGHVGCIGGHGRTGLVFAALRHRMTGDVNATQYVRDNYCEKVVETKEQVEWLAEFYDQTPVVPYYDIKHASNKRYDKKTGDLLSFPTGGKNATFNVEDEPLEDLDTGLPALGRKKAKTKSSKDGEKYDD